MRVEDDGHLTLHESDLLPVHRRHPPTNLKPQHFIREARITVWYARQVPGVRVTFARPGDLRTIDTRFWSDR